MPSERGERPRISRRSRRLRRSGSPIAVLVLSSAMLLGLPLLGGAPAALDAAAATGLLTLPSPSPLVSLPPLPIPTPSLPVLPTLLPTPVATPSLPVCVPGLTCPQQPGATPSATPSSTAPVPGGPGGGGGGTGGGGNGGPVPVNFNLFGGPGSDTVAGGAPPAAFDVAPPAPDAIHSILVTGIRGGLDGGSLYVLWPWLAGLEVGFVMGILATTWSRRLRRHQEASARP